MVATILLAHAALIVLLLRAVPHRDPVLESVMTLVAIPATAARRALPPPPPPPDPVRVESAAPQLASAASAAEPTTAIDAGLSIGGCPMEALIAAALMTDPASAADVAALSPATRAATGAAMLWNGDWSRADDPADAARLARLRGIVLAVLARAQASCLSVPIAGPRLIAVRSGETITLLAVGSGRWRWNDLARKPQSANGSH